MVDYAAEIERMKRESVELEASHRRDLEEHQRVNLALQDVAQQMIRVVNAPLIQLCDDIRDSMNRSEG